MWIGRGWVFIALAGVLCACTSVRLVDGVDGSERDGGTGNVRADGDGEGSAGSDADGPGSATSSRRDGIGADDTADPRQADKPSADPDAPASAGDGTAVPLAMADGSSEEVFDQDALRHYQLEVDPNEWAHINETAYLEEYIEGTLTVDGVQVAPVGVRFKGFRGSLYNCFDFDEAGQAIGRTCARLSIKLSFNEYDPEGRFFDLKKLNFHTMNNDPSKLRERLGYHLFRSFGVPAPRAVHATLSVNGQDMGLFALVEQVDGRFARMNFDDGGKGNVYKQRWPASSTDPEYFLSGLKTNENDPDVDVSAMVAFAEAVHGADTASIEAVLRAHTDFEQLMRYMAVDRAIDHWDGPTAFRCRPESEVPPLPPEVLAAQTPPLGWETCQNKNFYWYERTDDGRMSLVAWDLDVSFPPFDHGFPPWDEPAAECPVVQSGRPPMCDPLIAFMATTLRPHFDAAGREFLDEVFRPDLIEPLVRSWSEQIRPHLGSADLFASDPQFFIDRVAGHHADFEATIP